jgi:hypothetical protein
MLYKCGKKRSSSGRKMKGEDRKKGKGKKMGERKEKHKNIRGENRSIEKRCREKREEPMTANSPGKDSFPDVEMWKVKRKVKRSI